MKRKYGFTVIELVIVIVFLGVVFGLFFTQKNHLRQLNRDAERKTAVNAIYFNLTQIYYKNNKYYPETLTPETLPGMDPQLFTDPQGILLGELGSNYTYEASSCTNNQCQQFKITADLELEEDFTRDSN